MRNPRPWPGGLVIKPNKIPAGNVAAAEPMGVRRAGVAAWGISRQLARSPIELGQALRRPLAGMAENCGSLDLASGLVAWASSHGHRKGKRSQRLGLQRRQIAGLAERRAQLAAIRRPGAGRGRGLPPFGSAAGAMTVAAERSQSEQFRPSPGLIQCPNGRLGQDRTARPNGSGPGVLPAYPKNGVGGPAPLAERTKTGPQRLGGASGRLDCGRSEHAARAPFVERSVGSYGGGQACVKRH